MSLAAGTHLGPYQILNALGAGGMGEVYRARDTKLNRDVAIKVLPEAFAGDADRLARFAREAQTLAALNHPNIAAIYGIEDRAIVMELVEGQDLSEVIAGAVFGAPGLPLEDALPIAKQIAEALEAAHEAGIIHRDLKPANVKVRPDGTVKVLDFGLAKAVDPAGPSGVDTMNSPTLTARATQMGMIIGTAAYMAPEQAKGRPVDKRADIWAFGVVLYEMLTGTRAFPGEDITDTLAAVVRAEPEWERLPKDMSASQRVFLQRCLEKDPKRRVADMHDVRLALEGAFETPAAAASAPDAAPVQTRWQRPAVIAALALTAAVGSGLAVWGMMRGERAPSPALVRFSVVAPDGANLVTTGYLQDLVMSPDGTQIVYRSQTPTGSELSLRPVDQVEATPIGGTANAEGPFFSADGQWLGFRDGDTGALRRVPVRGGSPATITDTPHLILGASWGADGQIIFGTYEAGLFRVPIEGGVPVALTTPDRERSERHIWPFIIPGRSAVLFVMSTGQPLTDGTIAVLDLASGKVTPLGLSGLAPRYVSAGHLVYAAQDGSVRAVPFDVAALTVSGSPVPIVEGVSVKQLGAAEFSVSNDGQLIYVGGEVGGNPRSLVWVGRDGATTPVPAEASWYRYPRLSQDGQRVALVDLDGIRVWDFRLETLTRLTSDAFDNYPVWAPDGKRLAYRSDRDVYWKAWNNTGSAELLMKNPGQGDAAPYFFSPDGRSLVFREQRPDGFDENIGMIAIDGNAEPVWLLRSTATERNAVLSPNGRWIAYQSNASERFEVFVSPFPNFDSDRIQISNGGGVDPLWSADGRELFYLEPGAPPRLMVLPVETGPDFVPGSRRALMDWPYADGGDGRNFDIAPDGRRFLAVTSRPVTAEAETMTVVLHWFETLNPRIAER